MVKTDFIKNYIVNNYSKEFYNGILSNIRTDYDPVIKEDETGLYTEYIYSNRSIDDMISLKLSFKIREHLGISELSAEIYKYESYVNKDGSLRTGRWKNQYLVNDFNEELLECPYIETTLTYDNGYKDEKLYVSFCKNNNRYEFRFVGDITSYGSLKNYRILIKVDENITREIMIDERFGKCLVVYNEEGKGLLLSFFNKYYYDKKLVITYENSLTEIYERAVITNNSPGDYIMGAIHSHIYKMQNINSLDY